MESTVISDAVNLAARLEGLTKVYGASILISEYVLQEIQNTDAYPFRFLGKARVKDKNEAVSVYDLYSGQPDAVIELKLKI